MAAARECRDGLRYLKLMFASLNRADHPHRSYLHTLTHLHVHVHLRLFVYHKFKDSIHVTSRDAVFDTVASLSVISIHVTVLAKILRPYAALLCSANILDVQLYTAGVEVKTYVIYMYVYPSLIPRLSARFTLESLIHFLKRFNFGLQIIHVATCTRSVDLLLSIVV